MSSKSVFLVVAALAYNLCLAGAPAVEPPSDDVAATAAIPFFDPAGPAEGGMGGMTGIVSSSGQSPVTGGTLSADAAFAGAGARIFQVRTMLKGATNKTSSGSGFLVGADGLAITNYHVVSQYAFDPNLYRMEYQMPNGEAGNLVLLAIDVINDLAVVKIDKPAEAFFEFNQRALTDKLSKGERLYALGYPMELGFTIVEGTYNGLVQGNFQPRIHFTAAINAGMSGGPAVALDNTVVGVNVARSRGAQLVSFLVPAVKAYDLVQKARASGVLAPGQIKEEIGRQLTDWQQLWTEVLLNTNVEPMALGAFQVPDYDLDWTNCGAQTNADKEPKPNYLLILSRCSSRTSVFIFSDLYDEQFFSSFFYLKNEKLNDFAFAKALSDASRMIGDDGSKKHLTPERCYENFLAPDKPSPGGASRPRFRVTWCLRAYRDFDGLYNVGMIAVTQDSAEEALVAGLSLYAVNYENSLALTRNFLGRIGVSR